MKQFTLPLLSDAQRPIARIESGVRIRVMIDTGAVLPIWVTQERTLKELGGVAVALNQPFGGFGGMTVGTLYRIPFFRFGELIFPELPIIASRIDLPCQMILSATMFSGLIYEIDDCHHKLNVSVPDKESHVRKLKIEDSNGKLHIFCASGA